MRLGHVRQRIEAHRRGEEGETLLELVIAVVLIGLGVVAVLSALFSVVFLTNRNRGDVETASQATNIVERIQAAPYEPCSSATSGSYLPYLSLAPGGAELTITYLADRNATTPTWNATCATDQGAQRINVRVVRGQGTDRRVTNLVLIKRDDRCPASITTTSTGSLQRC